jgi:hypothetical protein
MKGADGMLPHYTPEDEIPAIVSDLRPEFDREGHLYQNAFNGHQTLRVGGVTKYSSHFSDFLLHPSVLASPTRSSSPIARCIRSAVPLRLKSCRARRRRSCTRMMPVTPVTYCPLRLQISAFGRLMTFTD